MIRIHLAGTPEDPRLYDVAGTAVLADGPIGGLVAFERQHRGQVAGLDSPVWPPVDAKVDIIYAGNGWVGGSFAAVRCRRRGGGFELTIADRHRYWVSGGGDSIVEARSPPAAGSPAVLTGPPLLLALALRDTFCLHASAGLIGGGLIAFCGSSGAGKSTLAVAGERLGSWQRAADDILPTGARGVAFPRFPQLKIADQDQPALGLPERVPIRALCFLEHGDSTRGALAIRPIPARLALVRVAGATAAARLFPAELLARHLEFSKNLAAQIPCFDLRYERRLELLPEVVAGVSRALEAG